MKNFYKFKWDIISRGEAQRACAHGLRAARAAQTWMGLSDVIQQYFVWCCRHDVITADYIEQYRAEFAVCEIYLNEDVTDGYVLVNGSNSVTIRGNSKAYAVDNSNVIAYDCSMIFAHDNSTATTAYGYCSILSYDNSKAYPDENCILRNYPLTIN
jgi:hypothetical protein